MNDSTNIEAGFNYQRLLERVVQNWYYFIITLLISLLGAYVYIRYAEALYQVEAKLYIKDSKMMNPSAEAFLEGMELGNTRSNIHNEMELIASSGLIKKTVQDLSLDVDYFVEGNVIKADYYKASPFVIIPDTAFNQAYGEVFYVNFTTDSTFEVYQKSKSAWGTTQKQYLVQKAHFGKPIITDQFYITLYPKTGNKQAYLKKEIGFKLNNVFRVVNAYKRKLIVAEINKNATMVKLSSSGNSPEKEADFLNQLASNYIQKGLEEKNRTTLNTIQFIEDYLLQISDSLNGADKKLLKFRTNENILDIAQTSEILTRQIADLQKEQSELMVKHKYYNYLLTYILNNYDMTNVTAPSVVGVADPLLNNLVQELYRLYEQEGTLGFSAKEKNPTYQLLELKIANVKKTLVENLKSMIEGSNISLKDINKRLAEVEGKSKSVPGKQSLLNDLERQYALNEGIYTYLMERKIEAGIALSSNVADHKIVEYADARLAQKVSPKVLLIYLASFLIGICVPLGILYVMVFFDQTINSLKELEEHTQLPIIGHAIHYPGTALNPVVEEPKSNFAESIRSLRVSLQYLGINQANKVIGITSSVSGEGKSFLSISLASSLAQTGKKALLIGCDLRKPRLHEYIKQENNKGLTTYLIGESSLEASIHPQVIPNLDVMVSGPIPPNPSEMIESAAFENLLTTCMQSYDVILLDATPIGLVSDYFLKNRFIDYTLYVVRQEVTRIPSMKLLATEIKLEKLKNVYLVYNDLKRNMNYGYAYGYEEKPATVMQKFYKKIKSLIETS